MRFTSCFFLLCLQSFNDPCSRGIFYTFPNSVSAYDCVRKAARKVILNQVVSALKLMDVTFVAFTAAS